MADQTFKVEIDFVAKNQELFDRANKQAKDTTQAAKGIKNAYALYRDELQKLNPELVKQLDLEKQQTAVLNKNKDAARAMGIEMRNIRAQIKEIRASAALLKDSADDIDRIANPLAAGGAFVVGGIFAAASKYVKDAQEATQTTIAWKAAQDDLNRSGERIGAVLADTALPLLEDAARITGKLAGFIEANPGIAKAALNAGLISLAVGTLGKAVASGIRLVADIKLDAALGLQLQAAQLQLAASENQLAAAGLQSKSGAVPTKGGIGSAVAGALSNPLVGVGAIAGVNLLISKQLDKLEATINAKKQGLGSAFTGLIDIVSKSVPGLNAVAVFRQLDDVIARDVPLLKELANKLLGIEPAAEQAAGAVQNFLGGSQENQDAIVKAFSDWKADDAKMVREAMENRKKILAEAEASLTKAATDFRSRLASIQSNFGGQFAALRRNFENQQREAEANFQSERAETIRNGNAEILQAEVDRQKAIEKLTEDHNARVADLVSSRDALGLAKENQNFEDQINEENDQRNEEIRNIRQQTAARLTELNTQFALEQQRRQADFEQRQTELKAQQAQAVKEAREAYAQQQKEIRDQRARDLRELQEKLNQERINRRLSFNGQLQDLGVMLTTMNKTYKLGYDAILLQAKQYIESLKRTLSLSGTTSGAPAIKDAGGYVDRGLYRMAWDGRREFVLAGQTTQAAERLLGGQLNQQNIMQVLSMFGNMRNAPVNYAPNINSEVSARTRRDLEQGFRRTLEDMIRN